MQTRKLGRDGPEVSALALGCMGMSEFYGAGDDVESIATIHRALDLGLNFLDTADMYGNGENEELIGRAIRGNREKYFVATKFGIVRNVHDPKKRGYNGKPAYVREACEASLQRLGIDSIDLYYQHRVDPATPIEETVDAMAGLVTAGKVRYLGLSECSVETLERALKVAPIAAVQWEYSLFTRDAEQGVLESCRRHGIGFVAYAPLGRGFLTGAVTSQEQFAANDYRKIAPRFMGGNFEKNLRLVEKVKKIAGRKGTTPSCVALAWLLAQRGAVLPLFGTKRRTYLEENVQALDVTLTPVEIAEIDAAFPAGIAAGARYPDSAIGSVNR